MRLLLDTHIWLWGLLEPKRLGRAVTRRLEEPANELWLSPVSVWETLLLAENGKVEFSTSPRAWVEHQLDRVPMRDAPLTREVATMSRAIDLAHDDPADRFIAATAVIYDLTLVTADERLWASKRYEVLQNR